MLIESAADMRRQWGCPGAGGAEPEEPTEMAQERLAPIDRMFGVSGLKTCPGWYLSQPGAQIAAEAYQCSEKPGGIESCFGRDPPRTLVLAAIAVRKGVNARQEDDEERRERERKR